MHSQNIIRSISQLVADKNSFQGKAIRNFVTEMDLEYFDLSNKFINPIILDNLELNDCVDSFIAMSQDFLKSQIQFQKTFSYPVKDQQEALQKVYSDQTVMTYYMKGLYLSYFLWPNHWKILKFFRSSIENSRSEKRGFKLLEVAPGHGLFTANVFSLINLIDSVNLVDISETSLNISKSNLQKLPFVDDKKIKYDCADFLEYSTDNKFDLIIMGEILEHVDSPLAFLIRIRDLLKPGGQAFLTTCTDAPSIDHCYHFKHCDEVRDLIIQAGFSVSSEAEIPSVRQETVAYCYENRLTVNYCGFIR